ncbi:uncharacterized protein DUF4259 [Chitinophaga dinghuensis]|uniref:Uncharacterized protein DUF4259 n=1 Tax=Chitinophaga dinghuensis TaxID=1539050 RepID=A0A327WBQ5_9BACT|nr:DUF4259 domain-containing protein [Chitinophaga dinghuensis]RAJ87262.1 uncharacterized protein DUF4259 [Chitinophaga dinghuensis]
MGTWSEKSFGNDSAGDWIIDLCETPTLEFIRETLQASIDNPMEADYNQPAIAAAEVICILDGKIPEDYHEISHNLEPILATLKGQQFPNGLRALAVRCIDMIATDSELKELWEDQEEWLDEINSLKQRLAH